jgi:hypothetical protein
MLLRNEVVLDSPSILTTRPSRTKINDLHFTWHSRQALQRTLPVMSYLSSTKKFWAKENRSVGLDEVRENGNLLEF